MYFPKKAVFHQILTVFPMHLLSFMTGLTMGWLPIQLYHLRSVNSAIRLTAEQGAWMASTQSVGRLVAAIPAGVMADWIGRKKVSLLAGLLYASVWFGLPFIRSFQTLCMLNFILGFGVGMVNVSNQMHLAEVVSANYRGSFHALSGFAYNFAMLIIALAGVYIPYNAICFANGAATVVYLLSACWIVESPYYLLSKGNRRLAEKNFRWLRTGIPNSEQEAEFNKIGADLEFQRKQNGPAGSSWNIFKPFVDPVNRACLFIVLALNFFIIFTGNIVIKLNSSFIFSARELVQHRTQYQFIISCVQFVASFAASFIMESFARRTLFVNTSLLDAIVLTFVAVCFYQFESGTASDRMQTVCFLSTLVYYGIYTSVLHCLMNMLRCELLPQNIKALGTGLTVLVQSFCTTLSILLFQYISDVVGVYLNFVLFAACSVLTAIISYFYLPEVKGRTLAEVYELVRARINRSAS